MKKLLLIKTAALLTIVSFVSSCAMHSGYITSSASLNSNNFRYIKRDVKGTAKATYVFGIGGFSHMALVDAAKKDLTKHFHLGNNQALVNLTLNWKQTYVLPFAMTRRCTVTGDIVEFEDAGYYK